MALTVIDLKRGDKCLIKDVATEQLPIKLLELGCLPGNSIELVEIAPLGDPLYLIINDTHMAIRREMAQYIEVELSNSDSNE
ncbi:MAG: ferrous iron transport protein A [Capnocytophaga granulosa]